jgi:two-component system response regulator YesN
MYRLLIVDDEAFIVNGLVEMVEEAVDLDLEVYKAFSAMEALDWLGRTKIDIVLSDISMPGMDGLALQRIISEKWPGCKMIFLTGYHDFSYIKEALRYQAVDYILKTEGDEKIRMAIQNAANQLDHELEIDALVGRAKHQLQAALPYLQRDLLLHLLREGNKGNSNLYKRFEELHIGLDPDAPVLLLTAMVDEWPEAQGSSDRALLLYAVQNISEELLSASSLRLCSISYDRRFLVWLIQTTGNHNGVLRFVQGTLERIQSVCKELLKLKISFAASSEFVDWDAVSRKFEGLKWIMNRSIAMGQELLLSDDSILSMPSQQNHQLEIRRLIQKLEHLEGYLESGNRQLFHRAYVEDMEEFLPYSDVPNLKVTVYYRLTAMFMSYLTKEGLWNKISESLDLKDLMPNELPVTWDQMADLHHRLAEWIFDQKTADANQYSRNVIQLIGSYIEQNLAGDLSLTRLGEVVALNPVYLSRLYKQCTGENLSDFVVNCRINKAKEMIKRTNGKMQDIALEVGFDSASYFAKCFKKMTNVTPQEYRETNKM